MENIIVLSNAAESMKAAMYIDPASTSLIIQIVAGVVITVGTVLGIYWRKAKSAVKKKSGAEETAPKAEIKGAEAGKDVITASDLLDDDDDDEE